MLVVALHILGFIAKLQHSITVRKFSLLTSKGENVLHKNFDEKRFVHTGIDRLIFKFNAMGKEFEIDFRRHHPIFALGATIKMTGDVREHTAWWKKHHAFSKNYVFVTHVGKRLYGEFTTRNFIILQPQKWRGNYFHQQYCNEWCIASARMGFWFCRICGFAFSTYK